MKLLTVRDRLRDLIERDIPVVSFIILFVSFVYSVIARYVFNAPPAWSTEVQVGSYIWTVMLSAAYVRRIDKHVKFDMLYDALNDDWKQIFRIFRNLLMGITYIILFFASIKYISRYRTMSPYFRIPVKFYFCPIIFLSFDVMVYSLTDVYRDVRNLIERKRGESK